jgi:hypothetical protein
MPALFIIEVQGIKLYGNDKINTLLVYNLIFPLHYDGSLRSHGA